MTCIVIEINCGTPGGSPLTAEHAIWDVLRRINKNNNINGIVLISETNMWDCHPDKYKTFLTKLNETLPNPSIFYQGMSANEHTAANDSGIPNVQKWNSEVSHDQLSSEQWHLFSHATESNEFRKEMLYLALNIDKRKAIQHNSKTLQEEKKIVANEIGANPVVACTSTEYQKGKKVKTKIPKNRPPITNDRQWSIKQTLSKYCCLFSCGISNNTETTTYDNSVTQVTSYN